MIFRRPIKDLFMWLVCAGAGGYALYGEQQAAFIVCLMMCSSIVWKQQTFQLLELVKLQLSRITQAKFAGLAINTDPTVLRAMEGLRENHPWMASLVEGLSAGHLSLLALANDSENHIASSDQRDSFRQLRARGLVWSDGTIGKGAPIATTKLGKEVLDALRQFAPLMSNEHNKAPEESRD